MEQSDWAWLPKHLLDMILDKLVSFTDYVRFSVVCKQWKCVARQNKVKFLANRGCIQVPFLMVPRDDSNEERRSLYNITQNRICDFQLRVPYKKRISGSSYGWLFVVRESLGITMINPFSGATIELPPIAKDSDYAPNIEFEVTKATLSADPSLSPNDYIVTVIYDCCSRLAFIRVGDETWTYIDNERYINLKDVFDNERFMGILDVIHYRDQILAVDDSKRVFRINVSRSVGESRSQKVELIAPWISFIVQSPRNYLVESSSGDLLLVVRVLETNDDCESETLEFKVFKLLLEQGERVEVHNLGGDAVFLGDNHSICVSASKWPGCQPDSIYYTDDYFDILLHPPCGRRDMGVFNVMNKSFGTHYILNPSHNHMPPAIWIVPTVVEDLL